MRVAANYFLYGGIAAANAALGWPENAKLDWRFSLTVTVAVLTTWKALMSKGGKEDGAEINVGPNDNVQVNPQEPL